MHRPSPPDEAVLIYNDAVDTPFGIKDIQLYWGSVHSILSEDCTAIVSSTIFNSDGLIPTGAAWRGLSEHLRLNPAPDFRRGLTAAEDSLIWPLSDKLAEDVKEKGEQRRPFISVLRDFPSVEKRPQCQCIICAHTFPARSFGSDEDTRFMMNALLSQLVLLETMNNLERREEPGKELVLSTLLGTQGRKPAELLKDIIEELSEWAVHLPHVRRFKVAYWDQAQQKEFENAPEEIRESLLSALGEHAQEPSEHVKIYRESIRKRLHGLITEHRQGSESLRSECSELLALLDRPHWTVRELGVSAGKLTEWLVMSLEKRLFGRNSNDFFSGIETITGQGKPKYRRLSGPDLSAWFNSYLHTLRVFRNASAHANKNELTDKKVFPSALEANDIELLLGSLQRVLDLHANLMRMLDEEDEKEQE